MIFPFGGNQGEGRSDRGGGIFDSWGRDGGTFGRYYGFGTSPGGSKTDFDCCVSSASHKLTQHWTNINKIWYDNFGLSQEKARDRI